jgi:hypothetical protein
MTLQERIKGGGYKATAKTTARAKPPSFQSVCIGLLVAGFMCVAISVASQGGGQAQATATSPMVASQASHVKYSKQELLAMALQADRRYGNPEGMSPALITMESHWNVKAVSRDQKGKPLAFGIAQFTKGTAQAYHVNPMDPVSAIDGMARYMSILLKRYHGDARKAIAAYNGGHRGVMHLVATKFLYMIRQPWWTWDNQTAKYSQDALNRIVSKDFD